MLAGYPQSNHDLVLAFTRASGLLHISTTLSSCWLPVIFLSLVRLAAETCLALVVLHLIERAMLILSDSAFNGGAEILRILSCHMEKLVISTTTLSIAEKELPPYLGRFINTPVL